MGSERQAGPFTGLVEGNKLLTMLVSIPRMASSVRLILISGMVMKNGLFRILQFRFLMRGWIPYLGFF